MKVKKDLTKAKEILEEKKNLPEPGGYKIYYTSTGKTVKKDEDYKIIGGRLCGKKFKKIGINFREPFREKCYKYSKFKDQKKFQIGAVIKKDDRFQSLLTGNVSSPIIKDYIKEKMVKNKNDNTLPYNPITKYITAKIKNIEIDKNGFVKIISNSGETIDIKKDNYRQKEIKPFSTIVTKGKNTEISIKFENQDIMKLEGKSIVKLKDNKIVEENGKNSLFWLIGKMSYSVYNSNHLININSPSNSMSIRGDILKGQKQIQNKKYKTRLSTNGNKKKTSKTTTKKIEKINMDIDSLFEDESGNKADILGTNKFQDMNIENALELK